MFTSAVILALGGTQPLDLEQRMEERFAQLHARIGQLEQRNDRLEAENDHLRKAPDRPASEHWPCQGLRNLKRLEMDRAREVSIPCEQLSVTTLLQKNASGACTDFYGMKQFTEGTKDAPMYWRCVPGNVSHCAGSPWFTCNGKLLDDEDCPSANRSPAGHAAACDYAVSVISSGEPTRRVRPTAQIACLSIALHQLRLPSGRSCTSSC